MKKVWYTKFRHLITLFVVIWNVVGGIQATRAEGSKDLYPVNAKGGRAYLRANVEETFAFPFSNLGVHYVYAEEGEQIALASNAQTTFLNYIYLYDPNGNEVKLDISSGTGKIGYRLEELAGPRLPGQGYGEYRYKPIYYKVPVGGTGVYRVEFLGSDRSTSGALTSTYDYSPATEWPRTKYTNYVVAWDISVAKQTNNLWHWVKGRVFTTMIAMNNPSYENNTFLPDSGFYGTFKVLTKDGYVYHVDNNGSQGISFTFMVNNQGFHKLDDPMAPSYESIPARLVSDVQNRYHDPRTVDTNGVITQKIFYNMPDINMPQHAPAAMDGGSTWLKVPERQLKVSDLSVISAEGGMANQGGGGAYIQFVNETGGEYTIEIKPKAGATFIPRVLKGTCIIGENKIYWDGKDGNGKTILEGLVDLDIDIELHGAEVHFPFIDVELNGHGTVIELLSMDGQTVRSDKVFWDDTSIGNGGGDLGSKSSPRNAGHWVIEEGVSSRENGHIWGRGTSSIKNTFGDNHGIDTWTFIKGDAISTHFEVEIKVADLEVVSVVSNKEIIQTDEEVTYTVKVKNNGPDQVEKATFFFQIPTGFIPVDYAYTAGVCGQERGPLTFDETKGRYTSQLDLQNQCEVVYTIKIKAVNPIVGPVNVEAAILRPADIVDPDASNQDENVPPTDPHYECENNGVETPCNNIKENGAVNYTDVSFSLIKDGVFNDLNNDGFAQVGETITYTLQVVNTGKTPIDEITVTDPLFVGVITETPVKSDNSDATLKAGQTWTYTITYNLTKQDIENKGVYNQATVKGKDIFTGEEVVETSRSTIQLKPNDSGYDENRPNHTYVVLPTKDLFISNPMARQRMK
ncbi:MULTISPECIES: DUF7507 domain-containing protein [unclassified Myroides]|uniref:DUF7507 domain-containing protein n=1 Tax=unclassified Myroides TaxID=2642485 RepID=UPI003D2F6CCB